MGIDPFLLQKPHMARLLDPAQRKAHGVQTPSEAQARWQKGEERKIHEAFEQWLRLHASELYWDHSRMDRPTSNRVGHPDFVIQRGGKVLNVEAKCPGSKLTTKQQEVHEWIKSTGGQVFVCYSTAEAIKITRETFNL